MEIFDLREFDGHELVVFGHDEPTALRAIIAVHSTALGPAAGGCRMWPYASTRRGDDGCAAAVARHELQERHGRPDLGGGKAVIIGDPRRQDPGAVRGLRPLRRLARRPLHHRRGRRHHHGRHGDRGEHTRFVTGLHRAPGEAGGDPSPKTALGVFLGIKAAVKFTLGRTDLEGRAVAVQGVGGVGYHLAALLRDEGAQLRSRMSTPR